ncbi:TrmH family RNA methyltransferase [Aureivirga marina]|uniref:TrmH family RNA methyltransferase n=1 Tax=Aureivirga marina TaxID=1182451 RepID=UPI0018CB887F|nr:RNA methyltransferase [Aureivirga marina]
MQNFISSTQNSRIKEIIQLKEKSRTRKKKGEFVVEGQREISLAISGGYEIKSIYYYEKIISFEEVNTLINRDFSIQIFEISKEVYEKIAYRETTEGVLAILKTKENTLKNIQFKSENPLILIGEGIEKPGNIGALLRTADASNLDAVIIANPKADFYNPNVIRSSVGCVFTNQLASGTTEEVISWLQENNIQINCAALTASKSYHEIDFTNGTAIVVGTEATGLTDEWLENSTQNIIIPMQGKIDSMNVSVAAAIVIFEAKRQRNFK